MAAALKGTVLSLLVCFLFALAYFSNRSEDGSYSLEQKNALDTMFDKATSNPDVHPIKGEGKILDEVEHLGDLPDLSLNPHKKVDAVVSAAAQVGIHIKPSVATDDEKARAAAVIAALMRSAEGKIKIRHKKRYADSRRHANVSVFIFVAALAAIARPG
jgi:hypothetical protein